MVRWLLGLVVVAAFGAMVWLATRPPPLTIQGEVSADRVDVSSRVAARAVALNADVGDTVEKGSVMAELDNPQLVALQLAAQASLAVAHADLDRIGSTRPETIATRKAELESAKADETLSQATYKRQIELARTGNAPQARVDEATRNLQMASRRRESAQAALELATTGASKEERALATAQVKQAQAVLNQRDVDLDELVIHAPISGQVTTRVAAIGENFSAGAPLFSLIDMHNLWFTFNLREDLLGGLKIGDEIDVTVPALKSQVVPVRVTMINVQGQYAAWRATRATGDFDLRTFEVRASPIEPVDGLRPGMTAVAATGFLVGFLERNRLAATTTVSVWSDDDCPACPNGFSGRHLQCCRKESNHALRQDRQRAQLRPSWRLRQPCERLCATDLNRRGRERRSAASSPILLALLLRPTVSAVSIGTLVTAPAFGFMGIGFPRLGMNAFSYAWGALLPGTWYLTARVDQTVRGTPIELSWKPVLVLLAFTIALAGLAALKLESMRASRDRVGNPGAPRLLDEVHS